MSGGIFLSLVGGGPRMPVLSIAKCFFDPDFDVSGPQSPDLYFSGSDTLY